MNAELACRLSALLRSTLLVGFSTAPVFLLVPTASADMPAHVSVGGLFNDQGPMAQDPIAALPPQIDDAPIGYFTPRVAGFRLGAAYAVKPDPGCVDATRGSACGNGFDGFDLPNTDEPHSDMLRLGADYTSAVAGIDLSLRAGYGAAIDDETWGLGASLEFAGFTVGAALLHDGERFNPTTVTGIDYVVGMVYTAPTWRAELQYSDTEPTIETDEEMARNRTIGLELSYTPSPQMTFSGGIKYGDLDDGRDQARSTNEDVFLLFGTRIGF